LIATTLEEDIDHVAILANRPPQVVSAASDLHEHLSPPPAKSALELTGNA